MKNRPLRRVAVTGLGVMAPLGHDPQTLFDKLCAGESGVVPLTHFNTAHSASRIGAAVQGFNLGEHIHDRATLRHARLMEAPQQWALAAARQALSDAGLEDGLLTQAAGQGAAAVAGSALGICLGTGLAGRGQMQDWSRLLLRHLGGRLREADPPSEDTVFDEAAAVMLRETNPVALLQQCPSLLAAVLAIRYGARGPNATVVSLCAASAQALGEAAWMIARGDAAVMLAGGTDSMLNATDLAAFARLDAVSAANDDPAGACKPFDARRDGCVVGEGAAMLVLEDWQHAQERGAHIHAELAGYGTSDDAWRISAPPEDGSGAALAMQRALDSAGLPPEAIGHINAHGTATRLNDSAETAAIHRVFGAHARQMPIVSTKSMTGHLIAAAGALEAVIAIQSLRQRRVPPTINLATPDARCDLDYNPAGARAMPVLDAVLSNSFAIGGVNASLLFTRPDAAFTPH